MDGRAAKRGAAGRDAAVVIDDHLLDDGQPQAGAPRTRREERLEHPRPRVRPGCPGRCRPRKRGTTRSSADPRTRTVGGTCAVAHASAALRIRLPNTCRSSTSSPSTGANVPSTSTSVCGGSSWARSSTARRATLAGPRAANAAWLGPGELQEVRHHVAQRIGFLPDAVHVGAIGLGQRVGPEQPAVAVDRGQAVAELVRDAGGQLPQPRQRFLEPQLLFQLAQRGEVRQQADDALAVAAGGERRHAEPRIDRAPRCSAPRSRAAAPPRPWPGTRRPGHAAARSRPAPRDSRGRRHRAPRPGAGSRPGSGSRRGRPVSTTSRPAVRLSRMCSLSASDSRARARICCSCAFSLATASCSAPDSSAVSLPGVAQPPLGAARRRQEPQHGKDQDGDNRRRRRP